MLQILRVGLVFYDGLFPVGPVFCELNQYFQAAIYAYVLRIQCVLSKSPLGLKRVANLKEHWLPLREASWAFHPIRVPVASISSQPYVAPGPDSLHFKSVTLQISLKQPIVLPEFDNEFFNKVITKVVLNEKVEPVWFFTRIFPANFFILCVERCCTTLQCNIALYGLQNFRVLIFDRINILYRHCF